MNGQLKTVTLNQITAELENLLQKRTGGSVNFRGVHYQILYTSYLILKELIQPSDSKSIRMEGIEDIDLSTSQTISIGNEFIQVKSSMNKMDASDFWNLGVLQNFIETYKISPQNKFKLVYNMEIANGNLFSLINKKEISDFWIKKLDTLDSKINHDDFFYKITFEHKTAKELYNDILVLLFKEWNLNKGTELQFLRSLFYNVFIWSKDRSVVTHSDINQLFQNIKDSYSKATVNNAIRNNWITKVTYESNHIPNPEDFYDGKAARPVHISLGLPARRKVWEKKIQESIMNADITVIKSSSGQGKSTLAWQTGFNLKEKNNYTIYQLHYCSDLNEANSIVEFLESRLLIGEIPLLMIDGLSSTVAAWAEIVQRTSDLAIKYLITTRQEDWFRFGADISRVNLMIVDISLSISEAKDIFEQFKRKQKIHSDITEWQPLWEKVHNRGLLIEYTYLLTRGQMIEDRLSSQLKYLNSSASPSAKMEILRMVSLADCLNIKLRTKNLIDYIKSEIGFDQDRGEILNELEKEYFLSFDGQYIEGLHPIRSSHLKDLLHKNLPIGESLINLYHIIEHQYRQDFFINVPLLLTYDNKTSFYNSLATILSEGTFSDMVSALDGIMHGEPQQYWNENKFHFDEAYNAGGIDLFLMTSTPFTELNTLDEIAQILGDKGSNFKELSDLKNRLSTYKFDNSDVILFANALNRELKNRKSEVYSYDGLGFLAKWFESLELPFTLPFITPQIQISDLIEMNFQEAKELMLFFQINNSSAYKDFTTLYKNIIISYLKVHTDSLTIKEEDNQIYIEYLLFDKDANQANNLSVSRIESVYAFLPFYEKYNTEAIMLPIPSEEIISIVRQNSIKHLNSPIVSISFDAHLNQIWFSTIQKNYQESSAYSWQNNILNIRKTALDWSKNIIRFIDALLEGNNTKNKISLESLQKNRTQLNNEITLRKKYPKYEKKYVESNKDIPEEKDIDSWIVSLMNINIQIFDIFIPNEKQERNIAVINLKAIVFNLQNMQNAFRKIEEKTIAYFDSEDVCKEEIKYYERLYATVLYYLSQIPLENKIRVLVGRKAVEEWWAVEKNAKLKELQKTLNIVEASSDYKFIYPDRIEETETISYCTFGVMNSSFNNQSEILDLLLALSSLENISCDFISVINVVNNVATEGIRFKREYFVALAKNMSGESVSMDGLTPLPIIINENVISTLPGVMLPEISLKKKEIDKEIEILFTLWELSESEKRLNKKSPIEMDWLQAIESKCKATADKEMSTLENTSDDFKKFVAIGLQSDFSYSQGEIISQIQKLIQQNLN